MNDIQERQIVFPVLEIAYKEAFGVMEAKFLLLKLLVTGQRVIFVFIVNFGGIRFMIISEGVEQEYFVELFGQWLHKLVGDFVALEPEVDDFLYDVDLLGEVELHSFLDSVGGIVVKLKLFGYVADCCWKLLQSFFVFGVLHFDVFEHDDIVINYFL